MDDNSGILIQNYTQQTEEPVRGAATQYHSNFVTLQAEKEAATAVAAAEKEAKKAHTNVTFVLFLENNSGILFQIYYYYFWCHLHTQKDDDAT